MSADDIEAEILKLDPQARARLAKKLLESLEALSGEENERLWGGGSRSPRCGLELGTRFWPASRRCASGRSGQTQMK
jgi:hypothetical protein